jgi:hypothetical protein
MMKTYSVPFRFFKISARKNYTQSLRRENKNFFEKPPKGIARPKAATKDVRHGFTRTFSDTDLHGLTLILIIKNWITKQS